MQISLLFNHRIMIQEKKIFFNIQGKPKGFLEKIQQRIC